MLNYLGQFIPNLSIESTNIRKLLEKDNGFIFVTRQTDAFNKLKQLVAKTQANFFGKNLPIKITCDASKIGLGAMLEKYMEQFGTLLHLPLGHTDCSLTKL